MKDGRYDIVFWQNSPSIHQAPLMRALASSLRKRVLVVVAEGLSADRRAMGWDVIDYGGADLVIQPRPSEMRDLVEANRDAVAHVFSGLGAYPTISKAMKQLARGDHNHIAVITEPWDPRGLRGVLRALRFRYRIPSIGKVDTLFACGTLAERQFGSIGIGRSDIVPFGYFVDGPVVGDRRAPQSTHSRLIFVGTFTEWKDPETLLEALSLMPSSDWELTMVGDGPLLPRMIQLARSLNLSDRVTFVKSLANSTLLRRIADSDLLILPSAYDGWGAVVSEALMVGTPVVVSRACGAADLVQSAQQGVVVSPSQPRELCEAIDERLSQHPESPRSREALRRWANAHISPQRVAQFLWDTVTRDTEMSPPSAPWRISS